MCGRYAYFSDDENAEIRRIAELIESKYGNANIPQGEIHPSDNAVVLLGNEDKRTIGAYMMRWGFKNINSNSLLINARSESVYKSKIFAKDFYQNRCIVPSTGFYEWTKTEKYKTMAKNKYIFNLKDEKMLYMAGIYDDEEKKFVILTTDANDSVMPVHNRMPLILNKKNLKEWIYSNEYAIKFLKETPPPLISSAV